MKGQWIGTYQGDVDGKVMINVDEVDDHYEGIAYLLPNDKKYPSSVVSLKTTNKDTKQEVTAEINSIDPRNLHVVEWNDIKDLYAKDIIHSNRAQVKLEFIDGKIHINAISDIGVSLVSIIEKPSEIEESKIEGIELEWSSFKAHIEALSKSNYLYRGQKKPWRLRTSFHRRGRYRINKFITDDVTQLHQRLSAITKHYFNLGNPEQNGSFFNLLQHHGYPTPLLDWSYSPYVSAFFAFRNWPINYDGEGLVRIYIFDNDAWLKNYRQITKLDPPFPHLSVMDFIAIDNPRLVPQQAVTTVTNIDDIEAYVLNCEKQTGIKFLSAIDLSAYNREEAMRDLRIMGITAGSMFPGIDGVCEEFREKNFNK
jgi:hypothetical protein